MENPPQRPTTETLYTVVDFLIGFITWLNVGGLCIDHISLAESGMIYSAGMVNSTRVYSVFCLLHSAFTRSLFSPVGGSISILLRHKLICDRLQLDLNYIIRIESRRRCCKVFQWKCMCRESALRNMLGDVSHHLLGKSFMLTSWVFYVMCVWND